MLTGNPLANNGEGTPKNRTRPRKSTNVEDIRAFREWCILLSPAIVEVCSKNFFHGYVLVKGNLWSNVKEASLTESFFYPWDYNLQPFFLSIVLYGYAMKRR